MKNKDFNRAVWDVRKRYMKPRLSKKELAEAYLLYKNAGDNKERFQELLKGMWK